MILAAVGGLWYFAHQIVEAENAPGVKPAPVKPAKPRRGTLLLFTQKGCAPCARLKSNLADPIVREALAPWHVEEVASVTRSRRYKVGAYPTLVAEVDGKEASRRVGYVAKGDLIDWLQGLGPVGKVYGAKENGRKFEDGTEISCDLPGDLHRRNTASKGLGNCVFTSIHHSAIWQNIPAVQEFPKWLITKGIPGGGYPAKVDKLIPQICKDRGLPIPEYIQIENADHETLVLAHKTGRMTCVTYARSPTGRYGGQRIAHMTNLVHADANWIVCLDNNYMPKDPANPSNYEWMTPEEGKRAGIYDWVIVFLPPPPPPPPRNST